VKEPVKEAVQQPSPAKPATTSAAKPATTSAAKPATPPATPPAKAPAAQAAAKPAAGSDDGPDVRPLRGASARVVTNMEASLHVPTATSVRAIPAKLLIDNRIVINSHLKRSRGGKVSFTHLIGFAVVKALGAMPEMNHSYAERDGKPVLVATDAVNLGLAIDLAKPDGTRQLLVPSIKNADQMDFAQFWSTYEDLVRRARAGKLTVEDFAGTTISLTNPGTIGTVHSAPAHLTTQQSGRARPRRRWHATR
jgi:2-oxoglutarate dehydrogenase E1 component